jgi:hypothetical protein
VSGGYQLAKKICQVSGFCDKTPQVTPRFVHDEQVIAKIIPRQIDLLTAFFIFFSVVRRVHQE